MRKTSNVCDPTRRALYTDTASSALSSEYTILNKILSRLSGSKCSFRCTNISLFYEQKCRKIRASFNKQLQLRAFYVICRSFLLALRRPLCLAEPNRFREPGPCPDLFQCERMAEIRDLLPDSGRAVIHPATSSTPLNERRLWGLSVDLANVRDEGALLFGRSLHR